ncbi:thioredoxin domain-containing protein [Candidatus Protofrankia californiensis]|uniref:thioredoxin domain-containing protein n=1 Tax=Candidatus Protofrankia californiensis TaxID=1839754 RepID=UPI001040FE7C|nr:thioredoxin domain-containing protein [Candidatus Protofrankia californiensis]
MPNRLADQTSPYLLQHADNPVDWWPWGSDAFAEAVARDAPVLLSVGYASCHWCHVMAHESFEDPDVASIMNEHFVNVKVDREERPDVDAVYMDVTVALTGQGGWPMTVFLTPAGEPFFAGTYFPPVSRPGMGSFRQLLVAVTNAWRTRRDEVAASGADIARQIAAMALRSGAPPARLTDELLGTAVEKVARTFDPEHAGFGSAPKFPPSALLEMLLRHQARTGDAASLRMVTATCERMARGGIYDQLAGGFARYSVDATWTVPHFEKMLYDNAQLLRVYLHLWRATGSPLAERVARETAAFLLRDLGTAEGGFASALDADTVMPGGPDPGEPDPHRHGSGGHSVEGATYVWTPAELVDVLGPDDGAWATGVFGVTAAGTFEHGTSVLQLRADPDEPGRFASVRERLFRSRAARPQPARDDKIVAAWNGLAIAALAEAGALLAEPAWVVAATRAATLLRDVHLVDGRLRRTSRHGRAGTNAGVLEDYGDVAEGLLVLHQITGDEQWLALAGDLLAVVREHFTADDGGFHDTADDAELLLRRPRDPSDSPTPSGQAAVAGALLTYSALTASYEHRQAAERVLETLTPLLAANASFAGWAGAVGEALVAGPAEVAVVDRPDLERVARLATSPGAVVVTSGPLARGRTSAGVYVCRGFVCERPVTTAEAVRDQLGVRLVLPSTG